MPATRYDHGNVVIHHHSTASVMEVEVVSDENGETQVLWLGYYDLAALRAALALLPV